MRLLQKLRLLILFFAVIGVFGCEHENNGTGVDGGPITFAGDYAPPSGQGVVVSVPNITSASVTAGAGETIGIGDGVTKSYSYTASNLPIVPGSVQISDGIETFTDTAQSAVNGTLNGSGGGVGTIEYATGKIKIKFSKDVKVGTAVVMTFQYVVQGATASSPLVNRPITMLTVVGANNQETKLTFTDNNGCLYSGNSSGILAPEATSSPQQFSVSATFSVTGLNAANQDVVIEGSFSGEYNSGVLKNRQINGTYTESDGVTGYVLGNAGDISVGPMTLTNSPTL